MKKFIFSIITGFILGVIVVSVTISWWFATHQLQLNTNYTITIVGIPIMSVIKLSATVDTIKTLNFVGVSIVGVIFWVIVYGITLASKKLTNK